MKASRSRSAPAAPDRLFDESLGTVFKRLVGAPAKKFIKELPQKVLADPSVEFVQAAMGGSPAQSVGHAPRTFDHADR